MEFLFLNESIKVKRYVNNLITSKKGYKLIMKKVCISFLLIAIIILSGICLNQQESKTEREYLRIHIRANSNDFVDQTVKYKVKTAVVEYLTPFISECDSKVKAQKMLSDRLDGINQVADSVLKEEGFNYTAKSSIRNEQFPTRVYGELQLDSGFYDALIIELGSGSGDNWWCVVYPPLCFVENTNGYVYKSKILEVINDFINSRSKK